MGTDIQVLMWLGGQFVVGAAIWGGIRTDLRNIHSRLDELAKSVDHARRRMDNHLERERK
jgi:hypothetical protein